jgi:hypothetical protein
VRNKYPGHCGKCGVHIEKGKGWFSYTKSILILICKNCISCSEEMKKEIKKRRSNKRIREMEGKE